MFQILNRLINIHKGIACVILIVFTISIIPKKYFHDFFSHHIDYLYGTNPNSKAKEINTYKFNCGFKETLAIEPYIESKTIQFCFIVWYPALKAISISERLFNTIFEYFIHRGPPSAL